jgi:hypothetical protein
MSEGEPMRVVCSNIVTAFSDSTIGTKVISPFAFWNVVRSAIAAFDWERDCRIPGQAFIQINAACPYVSSGVGIAQTEPTAYVLRTHRGRVGAYLKREFASKVTSCAVVVYTKEAYLQDPDIDETPGEDNRIMKADPDYVLTAVLAKSGEKPVLSPYRFVKNLAGGNNEALAWSAEEIRAKAREIASEVDMWSMVAD